MTMANEERLMTLRARLFKMIEKAIAEDPHHKSYEGAISIELPNYFEDGNFGFYSINLDCYVLGWQRHYTVSGKTFTEALDKFEKLLDEFGSRGEDG